MKRKLVESASSVPASGAIADERYRKLVEGLTDHAVFLLDSEGMIQSANEGVRRIHGYEAHEIVGKSMSLLYPDEANARGWPAHELRVARADGRFEDEGWRVRKDGTRFWGNVVITAMRDADGQLTGFSKIARDLTERRRHEELTRRSEERFRLLVERVKDYAIFMLTPEGRVASWNDGAQHIKGYTAREIVGEHVSRFYEAEAIARRWPEHELAVARKTGRFEDEGWRVRKDGTRFWANVVITALHDDAGELYGFAKVTRDLTARMQVEEFRRSERQTNEFLAMLAHELRNPLAPMRTALDAMNRSPNDADVLALVRGVFNRQLTHLTRLVDDLLDVSRITSGRIVLEHETLDLATVVREAGDSMRATLEARGHTLQLDLPEGRTPVRADPTRLAQIVSNLLGNAIKYTPDGGRIQVEVGRDGDVATLRVRDNGRGIAADLLPRIFDLFVQGERALAREESGLGVGLTIVKRLVELHGGTVVAASDGSGKGSEFVVRLPLVHRAQTRAIVSSLGHRSAERLSILVVDDHVDAANSMSLLLSMLGHVVETANDGRTALLRAPVLLPDVVFLDIGLPRMDGYAVARALRSLPMLDRTMLVACTGYGREEDRTKAHDAGFDRHVVKPAEADTLIEILSDAARRLEEK
jgi:PAS domain S-box-containing protein